MRTIYRATYWALLVYSWMLLVLAVAGGAPGWVFVVVLACGGLGGALAAAEIVWDKTR